VTTPAEANLAGARDARHRILIVRFDNDPTRDMTQRGIVAAVTRIESSRMSLGSQFVIVNQWR